MHPRTALAAFIFASFASFASQAQQPAAAPEDSLPAVRAFRADANHCSYMVSLEEGASSGYMRRFQADVDAAVDAIVSKNPGLSRDEALLKLRLRCIAALDQAN